MLQQTDYKYGFSDDIKPKIEFDKGLSPMVIRQISDLKDEPRWLLDYRIDAYKIFLQKSDLTWGADLSGLDFNDIRYYVSHTEKSETNWDDVPDDIKNTFDRLGIPEAEQKFLSGAGGQYDSEVVYHDMKEELTKLGVIFSDPETAFKEYPDIFKEYFGTVIPSLDNKFAALNSAVWSGGQNTMTHYMYGRRDGHPTHLCSCLPLICINAGCYPTYDQKHLRGDEYSLQFYSSDTSSSRNISGGSGDTAVCCSHDFCHTRYNWPNLCDSVYYDALPADPSTILSSAATIRLNQPSSTIVNGYAQSCTASTFNVTCYSPSTHNNWHCHHDTGSGGQVYITAGSRYHHCVTDVTQFAYPSFTGNTLCWYMSQPLNCISRFKIYTGSFGTYNSSMGDGAGTTILCVRYNCCHYFCGINRSTTPYVNSTAICFNGFLTIHSTYYGSWVTASSASFSGGYPAPLIYAAGAAPSKKDAFTTLWTHANAICGMRFQLAKGSNGCKLSALNGWTRVTVTYLPAIGPSSSLGLGKNEVFV